MAGVMLGVEGLGGLGHMAVKLGKARAYPIGMVMELLKLELPDVVLGRAYENVAVIFWQRRLPQSASIRL